MLSNRVRTYLAVLAITGTALLAACSAGDDPETIVEEAQEDDFAALVVDEPFEGTAPVDEVLSPNAFRLLDTLVVSGEPFDVVEGQRVVVIGTVRDDLDAVADELGIDLDEVPDEDLFVVADTVRDSQ